MPSVANVSLTDLSRYKVIKKGQFACNVMHVGRDERIPIAYYTDDEPAIISPAYLAFEVMGDDVLPEFLMINFIRPEFDRYAGFICDSSIRGGLEWERFCDIEIPLPDKDVQRKYVALYKALLKNQQAHEKALDDLQLVCDSFLEDLRNRQPLELLGPYIRPVEVRNRDGKVPLFQGISNNKHFMTPKQVGVNITSAKLVANGQFAYNRATTRNGDKISIAYRTGDTCAVSSAYQVFEIVDRQKLLPEYLLLWFTRSEFDRYARFKSEGSAHEFFDWNNMCNVRLPVPKLEVQKSIVAIHHSLNTRKRLSEELKKQIDQLCPILIRGVVSGLAGSCK